MEALFPLLLVACCVGMGLMMWVMMRGHDQTAQHDATHDPAPEHDDHELTRLRAEVDELRAAQRDIDVQREHRPDTS